MKMSWNGTFDTPGTHCQKFMILENIKDIISKFNSGDLEKKHKVYLSLSLGWIIFIGYLTWWNGIKSLALDKSFKWDEWFWFGIVPAISPYLFYFIWKKKDQINSFQTHNLYDLILIIILSKEI